MNTTVSHVSFKLHKPDAVIGLAPGLKGFCRKGDQVHLSSMPGVKTLTNPYKHAGDVPASNAVTQRQRLLHGVVLKFTTQTHIELSKRSEIQT